MGVSLARSADGVEAQVPRRIPDHLSTEAAITIFGIGMGAATAIAQLYAARRVNQGGFDTVTIESLIGPMAVATVGLLVAASMVPGPD